MTAEQCLYAIMLASANDAAYALSLNRNYIIFAIIVGIFAAGIILKVSTEKYRSKNRLGSKWKKKNIRRKRRQL